jgi:hypothetical protein
MRTLRTLLIAGVSIISMSGIQAQTVDEIIGKHTDAIGGKDILMKIKSISLEGAASAMGNDYPTKTILVADKGYKSVTSVNGADIIQAYTDTSGWMLNPLTGQTDAIALPADAVKAAKSSLDMELIILNYKNKGYTASLAGREDYQGVSAYKIKLSKDALDVTFFIDPTSYYILKRDVKTTVDGKDVVATISYSNYKKTDFGYVMAFTEGINSMGYDVALNYTKAEFNKDIDPAFFAMPK